MTSDPAADASDLLAGTLTGALAAGPTNVADLVGFHARERGDRPAIVEAFEYGRTVTWGELDELVESCARGLGEQGLVAGHRVALSLPNTVDFVVAYLGAARAGLVSVPVNPRATTGELIRVLVDSGSRLVVTDGSTVSDVRAAVAGVLDALGGATDEVRARSTPPQVVVAGAGTQAGELHFDAVLAAPGRTVVSPADVETLAALLYTSGTSGAPRGAMLTHRALLANITQTASLQPPVMRSDDVVLGLLPLFHVYGLNCVLGQALAQGATTVLLDRFDAAGTLEVIAEHSVTHIAVAAPVIAAWVEQPEVADRLSRVELVLSGAGPLDPDLVTDFEEVSGVRVEQGYGLTEAAPVVTSTLSSRGEHAARGSVGGPVPGVRIETRDASGRRVLGDDPAQVWVKGDNLFSGYWPDGADGPGDDGWYATGDVGFLDEFGDLFLVDRLRELVIVSGFNVYPKEVEDVIVAMEQVAETAVIGVEDDHTGEAVLAYVVPHGGQTVDVAAREALVEEVRARCETELARFKWPRHVEVVDSLPHSTNGKVAKGRLRAAARGSALGLR
ncbi:MAG: AMP-binding protein [Actinomycetota bacterium]|nr:AMP-binding protein [Actinomycetota bacterium]